jgi:tetratricopeptide (TPR) repeat protein
MKAEHRKELQTNALAHRMEQFVQGMKGAQKPTSITLWVIIGLAVVTFVWWSIDRRTSAAARSRSWAEFDASRSPDGQPSTDGLETVAMQHSGTEAARIAQLERARILLQNGLQGVYPAGLRDRAKAQLEEAIELYQKYTGRSADSPVIRRQALLGIARAKEALVITKTNRDDATAQLKEALDAYDRYLDAADPESPVAAQVKEHVAQLRNDPDQITEFYTKLNRLADEDGRKFLGGGSDRGLGSGLPPTPTRIP